jgi:uncharacterized protein
VNASSADAHTAYLHWQDDCLLLNCRLQPRASQNGFAGLVGNQLKIRITAAPVDGKANAHLIKFLAGEFAVSRQNITIIKGESSRQKLISIRAPGQIPVTLPLPASPAKG